MSDNFEFELQAYQQNGNPDQVGYPEEKKDWWVEQDLDQQWVDEMQEVINDYKEAF